MNTPIDDFLHKYADSDIMRLHMPGHDGLESRFDITEIDGADSLYDSGESDGIIAQSEEFARALFDSAATLYSCGGSTLSIQAMLALAAAESGKRKIVASRYAHKSLVHTAILLGLDVDWLYPSEYLSAAVELDRLDTSGCAGVFVNNVDYYGGTCELKPLSVPLIVDNAHGAYLRFVDKNALPSDMPQLYHPLEYKGISLMCADSAHKTLPVLTGGGYLHIADKRFISRAKEMMSVFGSSSPSYLILQSLDRCNKFIAESRNKITGICIKINELKKRISAFGYTLKNSDYLRVTINAAAYGYTGYALAEELRKRGAEPEMADACNVVLLLSCVVREETLERLYKALADIPKRTQLCETEFPVLHPKKAAGLREAFFAKRRTVPISEAINEVCASVKAPCPPCVPLVMPGEIFSKEAVQTLTIYGVDFVEVIDG